MVRLRLDFVLLGRGLDLEHIAMTSPLAKEVDVTAEVAHVVVIPVPFVLRVAFGFRLYLLLAERSRDTLGDGRFIAVAAVATEAVSDLFLPRAESSD